MNRDARATGGRERAVPATALAALLAVVLLPVGATPAADDAPAVPPVRSSGSSAAGARESAPAASAPGTREPAVGERAARAADESRADVVPDEDADEGVDAAGAGAERDGPAAAAPVRRGANGAPGPAAGARAPAGATTPAPRQRFEPTEQVRADFEVSFPTDI